MIERSAVGDIPLLLLAALCRTVDKKGEGYEQETRDPRGDS